MFDNLTGFYEAMIDWPKRLANEEPFYRHWFEKAGARSVIDVACGTGRHAAMFHRWGLRVEGSDISPAMIARARADFGEGEGLRWIVRGFDEPIEVGKGDFDVAICVGNSLALASNEETVERVIGRMLAAVRPGGIVLVQVLNLWHLPDGPCVWQKCKKTTTTKQNPQNDLLILKGVHRSGPHGYVDFLVASVADGQLLHKESILLLGLEATQLEKFARQAGACTIHFFGDYHQERYERENSVDLIMVVEKGLNDE